MNKNLKKTLAFFKILKEEKAENRTLRVTDRLWEAARIAAEQEGKTRTRWITELMQREIDKKNSAQD